MVDIDWVWIPEGEFPMGLTEEQRELIRQRARQEAAYDSLSAEEQMIVEKEIAGLKEWHYHWRASHGKVSQHEETPREVIELKRKYPGLGELISIESYLANRPPSRVVKLRRFYIARYPITVGQCDEFLARFGRCDVKRMMDGGPSAVMRDKPQVVSWYVADMFCRWVGGRLPSLVEWEYAARGREGLLYPWGNEWDPHRGNFGRSTGYDRPEHLQKIGTYTPVDAYSGGVSPFGVWDMVGNLCEWTMNLVESPDQNGDLLAHYKGVRQLKGRTQPAWFWYLPAFHSAQPLYLQWYVGFRPVKDEWQNKYWPGFDLWPQSTQ